MVCRQAYEEHVPGARGCGAGGRACTPRSPSAPTRSPSVRQIAFTRRSGQFFRMLNTRPVAPHSPRLHKAWAGAHRLHELH